MDDRIFPEINSYMEHLRETREAKQAPHEVNLRQQCSRLKEHLIRRNIYCEERISGNTTVLEIKNRKSDATNL